MHNYLFVDKNNFVNFSLSEDLSHVRSTRKYNLEELIGMLSFFSK